jgi:hypothetical protein
VRIPTVWALSLLLGLPGGAQSAVLKQTLWTKQALVQGLPNAGLEVVEGDRFPWWGGYHKGHDIDGRVRHSGRYSARCTNTATDDIRGISCNIEVNQKVPTPIIGVGWSKAENVSRPAGGTDGYWLWPGGVYTDGADMVIHPGPFKYGTHDWQRCTLTLIPRKPLETAAVGGFLIHCTGTVWFDDLELWSLDPPAGTPVFDGYPVAPTGPRPAPQPGVSVRTDDGFALLFDANTGHVCTHAPGGLFVRDDGSMSDFVQPDGRLTQQADGSCVFEGEDKGLGLSLSATYRSIGQAIRIDGTLRDLRNEDRAVTLYFSYPVDAVGWTWQDDARSSRRIEPGGKYLNTDDCQVGTNWRASRYPFACVAGQRELIVLGAPLDVPRLWRFAYDAESKELYAAVDLGLSPDTKRFPSQASFSLVLYRGDPAWGFRGALQRYYELFPHCFTKHNREDGIWGFATIPWAKMEKPEDFGFQFIQGCQRSYVCAEHGWTEMMYTEPMTFWECSLAPDEPRTEEHILEHLRTSTCERERQTACIAQNENGELDAGPSTYMCDGYFLIMNPSPSFPYAPPDQVPKGYELLREVGSAIKIVGSQHHRAWDNVERVYGDARVWQDGYSLAPGEGRNGSAGMKLVRRDYEENAIALQTVVLDQKEPRPIAARVWVKAEGVTGVPDRDFGVVVDAYHRDGSYGPGIELKPETGTHDWQLLEGTSTPTKPLHSLTFHCLLRRPHTGSAWFDDAFVGEPGGQNVLACGDCEPDPKDVRPVLGGVMMDCFYSWLSRNYRREHWAYTDTPLCFDSEGRVFQSLLFPEIEFAKEVAQRLWPQGMVTFAGGMVENLPWAAPWIDVDAIEALWTSNGAFSPEPGWVTCARRALCYHRPMVYYLYARDCELTSELVELHLKRCAAYAIFPSLAEGKLAGKPCSYWETPELYNRDRPLWRKYIPVIKALSAAGWEPTTYARSGNPKVYVERFGRPGGPLYLTIYNDSDQGQAVAVQLEADALRLDRANLAARDVLGGAPVQIETGPLLRSAIGPYDVKVLRLDHGL